MMTLEVGAAAPGGYVRAVFSRKAGGFVAPLGLVRAQLGAAAKLALRARMRAAFAGYLASDDCPDDAALRGLEYISRSAFSARRGWYSGFNDDLCMTVDNDPLDARFGAVAGGPLDAPGCLPGGACDSLGALFGGSPQVVALREPVEIEPAFSERREHWRGRIEGMSRYWGTGSYSERAKPGGDLREGFECGALDAPSFVPGGAALWRESAGGFVGSVFVLRAGFW